MRRSGVRIPLAPPQADIRSGCRFFVCLGAGAVPGCCVARGAAGVPGAVCAGGRRPAREIATREPSARSGRSRGPPWPCRHPPAPRPGYPAPSTPAAAGVSKPGQAQPPPTGTAAWPSGPSGALHTGGTWCTDGVARRLEDRPGPATAHRDRGLALPPLTGTAVWPFGPSGTLHTGGTWCAVVSTGSASTLYAVQSSPCTHETRQNGPFRASRASFIPHMQ